MVEKDEGGRTIIQTYSPEVKPEEHAGVLLLLKADIPLNVTRKRRQWVEGFWGGGQWYAYFPIWVEKYLDWELTKISEKRISLWFPLWMRNKTTKEDGDE